MLSTVVKSSEVGVLGIKSRIERRTWGASGSIISPRIDALPLRPIRPVWALKFRKVGFLNDSR